ncbi:MAG: hypothetical protein WCO93_08925 [bacterium]
MKTFLLKSTFITMFILVTGSLVAQEKFDLEFRYKAGDTYKYRSNYNYDMVQEMNGQEMKMSGTSTSLLQLVTESVTPGGDITFITSYQEMSTSMKNPMMDTTIVQKELIGKRGKVVMDKYGKEISKQLIDSVAREKGMASGNVASIYTVNFVKLPGKLVSIGEKWTRVDVDTVQIGEGNTITTTYSEYTLLLKEKKDGHECLNIAVQARSESTGKMVQMGMEMFLEGTSEMTGAAWIDPVSGILVARESTTNQEMTYALTGQMKMTIPSTQTIRTSFKLVE